MLNYFKKLSQVNIDKENLIIINFDGRMGNQMFQWALGRAYQKINGTMPIFDDSEETIKLGCFNLSKEIKTVKKPLWNKVLRKAIPIRNLRVKLTKLNFNIPILQEQAYYQFDTRFLTAKNTRYFKGYFQCEQYFKDVKDKLIDDFTLIKELNKANKQILEQIKSTNSISLHFRRGDYLKSSRWGVLTKTYYQKAIDLIVKETGITPTLFVFSDNLNWVKENVKFDYDTNYVGINSGKQGYFDLELMKNCKHNIIANSSFSWWAGYLNSNPNKIVIAPMPWRPFMKSKDEEFQLIPSDWRRIEAWNE